MLLLTMLIAVLLYTILKIPDSGPAPQLPPQVDGIFLQQKRGVDRPRNEPRVIGTVLVRTGEDCG